MATKKKAPAKKSAPKKSDAELVRETAANPDASLVGTVDVLEIAGCPLKITIVDGARATLELADHGPLDQAALTAAGKLLNQAIQETY